MRKMIAAVLIFVLLLSCTGCSLFSGKQQTSVVFYYEQAEYQYGEQSSVIIGEERDITGHVTDMQYLLSLYIQPPPDTLVSFVEVT